MRNRFKSLAILIVVAVLAVLIFIKLKQLPSLADLFTAKPVVIQNTPVVVKQIRELAQLVTVSMYEEIVVDSNATTNKVLHVPLLPDITLYSDEKILVMVGKVTTHVGIDMQKLSSGDITGTKDSIHILLPAAEVLDAIVNPSGVDIFIEQGDWNNIAVTNLKKKIQYLAIADAKSRGLLSQSENKARQILTDFFKAAGYTQVTIQYKGDRTKQN